MSGRTFLERLRDELGLTEAAPYCPRWRVADAGPDFVWIFDGARAVGMICRSQDVFELRCAGPGATCDPAVLPAHYHIPTQAGVRIIATWRVKGKCGTRETSDLTTTVADESVRIAWEQRWSDGSTSQTVLTLRYDPAWHAYVADTEAVLNARRVTTALEFCNVLPAGIGDSRPVRERYPLTLWKHPCGLRKMLKNPLWFTSVGAQDLTGEKHIEQGGFVGFGPDSRMNPVIEIVESDPEAGTTTCDGLQDEHVMVFPAEGRHAAAGGWFRLRAHYRLFSIPEAMARDIDGRATWLNHGPMLAWKFQYPAIPELPADLTGVDLPGSPFYGASDWSRGVPWDCPFNGRLWTASPDPAAAIHYDRSTGRLRPGSIRLRPGGDDMVFWPGSGHTLHLDEGIRYRFSGWIRTCGPTTAWLRLGEMLFRFGDREVHDSQPVGPGSDWHYVAAEATGRGDEAPFAETALCANGTGEAWFTDIAFEPLAGCPTSVDDCGDDDG